MSLAIKHALIKRDVSHLTFPDEVQVLPATKEEVQTPEGRITSLEIAPPEESISQAMDLLKRSKRPVIIVGYGARFQMSFIITLAEKLNCAVLTTFKAKGQISDHHRLGCGVLGRSGTPIASYFMNESDLLLVIGASFSNHTGITPKKPTIQIDFDPLALSKFNKIDVAVYGEISRTMRIFEKNSAKLIVDKVDQTEEIAARWSIWTAEKEKRLLDDRHQGVSSIAVFDTLSQIAPDNAVMCVDVGNNAYSFGRYFESIKHTFLMSGYLGSIGFALPASIGVWAAVGDSRPIIAVAGDGGLCQYLAEFTTLVKYNIPVKLFVLNNNELGKISKEQRAGGWDKWATDLVNPNFADYANSCGGLGVQVTEKAQLENAMKQIFAYSGPALMEVKTDVKLI